MQISPACFLRAPQADAVLEKMIQHFGKDLYEKLRQLPLPTTPNSYPYGHHKSLSLESAGESVSSDGSADADALWADRPSLKSDSLSSSQ
jgi:hypothetical protein